MRPPMGSFRLVHYITHTGIVNFSAFFSMSVFANKNSNGFWGQAGLRQRFSLFCTSLMGTRTYAAPVFALIRRFPFVKRQGLRPVGFLCRSMPRGACLFCLKQEKTRIFFPEEFARKSAGSPAGFRASRFLLREGNRRLEGPKNTSYENVRER